MNNKGYITLNRGFFDNPLWKEKRVYSRAEAWLDLIQSARFEAKKEIINNRLVEVQRGQLIASRRYLQKRWGWGGTKVLNFINLLISEGMIDHQTNHGQTTLTLCKYNDYNKPIKKSEPNTNHRQTTDKPNINKVNIDKESKAMWINFFNYNCGKLPEIRSLSNDRLKSLKARISEHGEQQVKEAIVKAGRSNFMAGNNERKWRADFDWIMKPNNFPKVLEGNYDNSKKTEILGGLLRGQ